MRKITLAAVMLLCVVLAGCQKEKIADKEPEEAVKLAAENWGGLKDYQKNMTIQYETADGRYTDTEILIANGDLFKKQSRRDGMPEEADNICTDYIWDIKSDGEATLYTNDGVTEQWMSENWDPDEESAQKIEFYGTLGFSENDIVKILTDQTSDGQRVIKMEIHTSKAPETAVCTLWIDVDKGLPVKVKKNTASEGGGKITSETRFIVGKEVEKIELPDL